MFLQRLDVSKYPRVRCYLTPLDPEGNVIASKRKDEFKLLVDAHALGPADEVSTIEKVGEPIYLVLVAQTSAAMNEVFESEVSGLAKVVRAVGRLPDSKVAVLAYAREVRRVADFAAATRVEAKLRKLALTGASTEVDLLDAVRSAVDALNSKGVPENARRLVVIFSDGIDVSGTSKAPFRELGKRASLAGINIDTVGYAPFEAEKLRSLAELAQQSSGIHRTCANAHDVGAQLGAVADEITKQYVVQFQSAIAADGQEHTFQVVDDTGGQAVYSDVVAAIPPPPLPPEPPMWPWAVAAGVAAGALALLLGRRLLVRRTAATPPLRELAPPAPADEAPQRTVLLMAGEGGRDAERAPAAAWFAPLSGPQLDETLKLRPGRNVVGSAQDADLVVQDATVSGKHCEVRYVGGTYRIVDLGSSNGVYLNDKRVVEAELVDNDTVRLGRTELRFKSIT